VVEHGVLLRRCNCKTNCASEAKSIRGSWR
jgi:hypothetical protein